MSDGQSLQIAKEKKLKQLDDTIRALVPLATKSAEAKRSYRISYQKELLRLKADGTQATIIESVCKGNEEIAKLEFDCSVAEANYDCAKENVNCLKLELRLIGEEMGREWSVAKE